MPTRGRRARLTGAFELGELLTVVVDAANVIGSRPDGWWRDRAAAASRLVDDLARLPGLVVALPDSGPGDARARTARVRAVEVVLEGRARQARIGSADGVRVVLAPGEGDDTVVDLAERLVAREPGHLVVVTADRGLRARLPRGAWAVGPRWVWNLLDDSQP